MTRITKAALDQAQRFARDSFDRDWQEEMRHDDEQREHDDREDWHRDEAVGGTPDG